MTKALRHMLFILVCLLAAHVSQALAAEDSVNASNRSPAGASLTPFAGPADVIVIDPGHGGEDSGAIGPSGIEEKKITLSLALKLADRLKERLGCKVLLTRTDDTFVPLADRTAFANRNRADIFISIHVNAALSRDASGVETFFMSFDATDDDARKVAAFENNVMRLDASIKAEDASEDLKDILIDLAKTESHHESSRLAEMVQASLLKMAGKEDRGVKQAPFVVLTGAAMPAILVEVGFISNPREERWLNSRKDQVKIVDSIADGVIGFKKMLGGEKDFVGYDQAAQKN